jgi:DNA polymerase III subunit epsilon
MLGSVGGAGKLLEYGHLLPGLEYCERVRVRWIVLVTRTPNLYSYSTLARTPTGLIGAEISGDFCDNFGFVRKLNPMYLFFDTETTGLPKNWKAPVTMVDNWPRLVQIAWIATDEDGEEIGRYASLVKPAGFTIPRESERVHGISTERALVEGMAVSDVLKAFAAAVEQSRSLVAHNMSFDEAIVGAELIRGEIPHQLWNRERICTKLRSTNFCAIPGNYGYKWPTLVELHTKLFGTPAEVAHDALADVEATVRCFFELRRLDVI